MNRDQFEILGFKVRFKANEGEYHSTADEVVEQVQVAARQIKTQAPHLSEAQIAILVALKMANDYHVLASEYKHEITRLKKPVQEILGLIEEVVPTSV